MLLKAAACLIGFKHVEPVCLFIGCLEVMLIVVKEKKENEACTF